MKTRLVSIICAVAVMLSVLCIPAVAELKDSYIYIDYESSDMYELKLSICVEDSGYLQIKKFGLYLTYSGNATLVDCEFNTAEGTGTIDEFILPGIPTQILWDAAGGWMNYDRTAIATLTFILDKPVSEATANFVIAIDGDNMPMDQYDTVLDTRLIFEGLTIEDGEIVSIHQKPSVEPEPPKPKYGPGDVNYDGSVNLSDVTLVLKLIAKWNIMFSSTDNADVNKDGFINLSDVTLIMKYIAGWNVELK